MPHRNRAYTAIWQAVKSGKLKPKPCRACGSRNKLQAHHSGGRYVTNKSIQWYCDSCHRKLHKRLRQISKSDVDIIKSDDTRHLVYLIVVKPNALDTDSQWFEAPDIEVMAHRFMIRYYLQQAEIYEEHEKVVQGVFIVESYIAPSDLLINGRDIPGGTWVTVLWVPNEDIWNKIQTGRLRGASVRGPARLAAGVMPFSSGGDIS